MLRNQAPSHRFPKKDPKDLPSESPEALVDMQVPGPHHRPGPGLFTSLTSAAWWICPHLTSHLHSHLSQIPSSGISSAALPAAFSVTHPTPGCQVCLFNTENESYTYCLVTHQTLCYELIISFKSHHNLIRHCPHLKGKETEALKNHITRLVHTARGRARTKP